MVNSSAVFPSESASMCASKSACGITAAGSGMASAAARYSPSIVLSDGNQSPAGSGRTHAPSAFCTASGPHSPEIQSLGSPPGKIAKPVQTSAPSCVSSSARRYVFIAPEFHAQPGPV